MHISDKLKTLLLKIKNTSKVASFLLLNEQTNFDIDYIDISHTDPYKISYITKDRINKLKEKYSDINDIVWLKNRYHAKPGKLVKKLFDINDKDVELFTYQYGALIKKNIKFKIFNGIELKKYFHYSYYESQNGTLSQSCMRYDKSQNLLDFYCYNNNVSLLVSISNKNKYKITGRALLWETVEGYKIMDRIYTIDNYYEQLFYNWAMSNNYHIKKENNWYNTRNFISPENKSVELKLSVNVEKINILYPYLDTFKWLNLNTKKLYNYNPNEDNTILLMDINGSYLNSDSLLFDDIYRFYRPRQYIVYCNYLQKNTLKDDTLFSFLNNDFILKKDAINDELFGIIFKDDKFNDKKKMMQIIIDKVSMEYKNNMISKQRFNYYKNKFNILENEIIQ